MGYRGYLIVFASLIAFSPTLLGQQGNGVNFYSLEKERTLGQSLAEDLRTQVRKLTDPAQQQLLDDYLQAIGDRLATAIPDTPQFQFEFEAVVAAQVGSRDLPPLEPTAIPGGFIVVPISIITDARNEAELAGTLAHAMAHVIERHGTRQESRGQIVGLANVPLIFMGGWTGYEIRDNAQMAIPLGFLQFSRQWELEADRDAVQIMQAAGYNPGNLRAYFDRNYPTAETSQIARAFSRFPEKDVRLTRFDEAVADLTGEERQAASFETGRLAEIQAMLATAEVEPPDQGRPTLTRPGDQTGQSNEQAE